MLRMLEHPNVMYFHEIFYPGELFIVMDCRDGGICRTKLRMKISLKWKKNKRYFCGRSQCSLVHSGIKGIIHRDLKPKTTFTLQKDDSLK